MADNEEVQQEHMARMGAFPSQDCECVPTGFGFCATHPPCAYAVAQAEEASAKIDALQRENRRLRRLYIETAARMREAIEEWTRVAAWMKSAEENT